MEDDSSEFKLTLQASESTTKDGDESISSSDEEEYGTDGVISDDQMIDLTFPALQAYEDLSTLGGGDDSIIINAARVIDDVENSDVLEFRRFTRINLEERLEITGIARFRRYHNLDPKKKRRGLCKYSTCCYVFRYPSFLDDLPLLVKGPALLSLILLAISVVIIVAALIVNTMLDDNGPYAEISNGAESSATRGFDSPSSFDEFIPHQSSSQNVSQSAPRDDISNFSQPRSTHPPSPWGDHHAAEPVHEPIEGQNKSRNEPDTWLLLLEPAIEPDNEPGNEIINGQQVNEPSIELGDDELTDDSSYEVPEHKANIFIQGIVSDSTSGKAPPTSPKETITTTGPQHAVPAEKRDPNSPYVPWQSDTP